MTTANKITLARIFPRSRSFVMMAIYYGQGVARGEPQEWQRYTAIALFVLAAASDGLDGYIARRYNQRSQLGVILDPIADKGLLITALITLSISNWHYELPVWFPVLVIARDLIVVTGAVVLHLLSGRIQVKPSWSGKAATALQMVALPARAAADQSVFHHDSRGFMDVTRRFHRHPGLPCRSFYCDLGLWIHSGRRSSPFMTPAMATQSPRKNFTDPCLNVPSPLLAARM